MLGAALLFMGSGVIAQNREPDRVFRARRDRLTEIPSALIQRTNWVEVDVRSNKIAVFPGFLSEYDSLKVLRLGSNPIDWPDTLRGFLALEYWDLWDTDVDAVPVYVEGFQRLKKLDVRNTYLDERHRAELEKRFPGVEILLSERCDCRPKR